MGKAGRARRAEGARPAPRRAGARPSARAMADAEGGDADATAPLLQDGAASDDDQPANRRRLRLPPAPAPVKAAIRSVSHAGERVAASYPVQLAHRETWRIRRYAQALGERIHALMCCSLRRRAAANYASVPDFLGADSAQEEEGADAEGEGGSTDAAALDLEAQEWCVMLVYEEGAWAFLCALCRLVEAMLAVTLHHWHLAVYESVLGTVWLLALPWGVLELATNRRRRCALRVLMSALVLGVVTGLFVSLADDLRRVAMGLGGTLDPQTGERVAISLARALFSFPLDLATVGMFASFARTKMVLLLPAWEAMGHRTKRPKLTNALALLVFAVSCGSICVLHFFLRVPAIDFLG